MQETPLVSVIVPVYNVKPYLPVCLDSLLGQTYGNLEILVVDDGSTDGSGSVCDAYGERDSRIRVIHQENRGLSGARNTALGVARGEYLTYVDSDDFVHPRMVECLLDAALRSRADVVKCLFRRVGEDETSLDLSLAPESQSKLLLTPEEMLRRILLDGWRGTVWGALCRWERISDLRFEEGKTYEDILYACALYDRAESVVLLDLPLYAYRQRSGSIISSGLSGKHADDFFRAKKRRLRFLEKRYPGLLPLARADMVMDGLDFFTWWADPERAPAASDILASLRECVDLNRLSPGEILGTVMPARWKFWLLWLFVAPETGIRMKLKRVRRKKREMAAKQFEADQ